MEEGKENVVEFGLSRKLPEIQIEGITYIIDAAFLELRKKDDYEKIIRFHGKPVNENGKYEVPINIDTKELDGEEFDSTWLTEIDQFVKLDPEGIALHYGLKPDQLPKRDMDLRSDPALERRRLYANELLVIKFPHTDYFIDLENGVLRNVNDSNDTIRLMDQIYAENEKYQLFYNTHTKEFIKPNLEMIEFPKNVITLELPDNIWLDPVGCARSIKTHDTYYINNFPRYPLLHHLEVRMLPATNSGLKNIIENNRELKQLSKIEDARKQIIEQTNSNKKIAPKHRRGPRM